MTKQDFIDFLEKDNLSKSEKIEVCQYFIDNYPVKIGGIIDTPMGKVRTPETWTGLNIKINGGSDKAVDHAFNQLKKRINEFKLN